MTVFQEPEASDTIQAGTLKALTGGDTMSSRENYGPQTKWRARFKSFLVCNDLPKMSENTWALWRRVRCIQFLTSFVENPCLPHERQIDHQLDQKLKAAAPWFIGILIDRHQRRRREGLKEPAAVLAVTKKYQDSQDLVKQFIGDHMVQHADQDVLLPWVELREAFSRKYKKQPPYDKIGKDEQPWVAFTRHGLQYVDSTLVAFDRKRFRGFRGWSLHHI